MEPIEYFRRIMDRFDVFSFDIFDTLIYRSCAEPDSVF